jgi:malate dehydrogenase
MATKLTVIGAGNVGSTTVHRLSEKQLGDIVLLDRDKGIAQGKVLDLMQTHPIDGFDAKITGTDSYQDTANSDIVVIAAGSPRKPGMTRDDLLKGNATTVRSVTENVVDKSPDATIIVVTNPLDMMTYVATKVSGFPRSRVIGMAGALDSARLREFIAMELDASVWDVQAMVLGGHGDLMVPLMRHCSVAGIPITELMTKEAIEKIVERTRKAGGEIVGLLKTGSAFWAPASAITQIVESMLKDTKRIVPCSVYLEGEYGLSDVCVGVPVKLGAGGAEQIIEVKLNAEETAALHRSAETVRVKDETVWR